MPRFRSSRPTAAVLAALCVSAIGAIYLLHPALRAEIDAVVGLLARADVAPVREYVLSWGVWAPVGSAFLQLLTSVIAPLPSFVLAFVNAMLFGLAWGALLTWSTALLAAAVCFGMSRALGRPAVERLATRRALEGTDRFFARNGIWAVLVARLIPFINPDVISYAAGLTNLRWRFFMLAIALGSVPSTLVYSYLGARGVTSLGWLLFPLVGLGILALIGAAAAARRPVAARRGPRGEPAPSGSSRG